MINIFYLFIISSFLGWFTEVIFSLFRKKMFVNRGFLYGPICPIYGIGVVIIYLFLDYFTDFAVNTSSYITYLAIFIIIAIVTTVLEYITGYTMEKLFHARWWDYSENLFNINGYVCLKFTILWGIGGTLLALLAKFIINMFDISKLGNGLFLNIANIISVLLLIDIVMTIKSLVDFRKLLFEIEKSSRIVEEIKIRFELIKPKFGNYIRIQEIKNKIEEKILSKTTMEIKTAFSSRVRSFYDAINRVSTNRLYRAFPDMKINLRNLEKRFVKYMKIK